MAYGLPTRPSVSDPLSLAGYFDLMNASMTALRGSYCLVTRDAAQSINNDTLTTITMDHEYSDTGTYFDIADPTKITLVKPGFYSVVADVLFAANTTGVRELYCYVNGVVSYRIRLPAVAASSTESTTPINLPIGMTRTAGQYLEFKVVQTSGGALNVTFFRVSAILLHDLST